MYKTLVGYQSKNKKVYPLIQKETCNYKTYQLIPDKFVKDGKIVEEILTSISALRKSPILLEDKKVIFQPFYPIFYEILYKNKQITFNYAIPDVYSKVLANKIESIYKTSTFKPVKDYFTHFNEYCNFKQSKHYMFSINVDYRLNGLIENLISMISNIEKEDTLCLQIGLMPLSDSWKQGWMNAYKKYKQGNKLERNNSLFGEILDKTFNTVESVFSVLDMIVGQPKQKNNDDIGLPTRMNTGRDKRMTLQKINHHGFQTQIRLYCSSKAYYYGKLFDGVFRILDADQEIKFINVKNIKTLKRNFENQIHKNIYSSKEIGMFIQMPNRRMQMEFKKQVISIENRESNIPKELKIGYLPIGNSSYKGNDFTVYWNNHRDIITLPKIIIGSMGSGKSEYTKNFIYHVNKKGDSCVVFDFIKNCDMTNDIANKMNNVIVIDLSKDFKNFAMAFPEIQPESNDPWKRLEVANILSRQTEYLINSLTEEELTVRMTRILDAACKVVYIHKNTKVSDVLSVLLNHNKREQYIKMALESECFTEDDNEILDLRSLNEMKKDIIVGTRYGQHLEGIFDRINILQKDIYLRSMMKAEINYDYDFKKWIDNGKTILIQIPEHTFTTKSIKDTIMTYFMSRIWLSVLKRKSYDKVCHICTDEIHQVKTCASFMSSIVVEGRKFGVDFYFTIHYLKQFRQLYDAVKSAGASYMLLAGTEKENFNMLKEELNPYDVGDLLGLKQYTSLNLINYKNQYIKFISNLPPIV